jgi:hypothetical protein
MNHRKVLPKILVFVVLLVVIVLGIKIGETLINSHDEVEVKNITSEESGIETPSSEIPEKATEPSNYLQESSRVNELEYYPEYPTGYTNPSYSNIVGYNYDIGITMSIPAGVVPSLISNKDIGEVVAYRLEDKLTGVYNDAVAIFSCFEPGFTNIKNISYIDFSEKMESKNVRIDDRDYYVQQFESFYILYDTEYMDSFKSDKNIFGCGLVMIGKELSEIHTSFIGDINYIQDRQTYLQKIFDEFNRRY